MVFVLEDRGFVCEKPASLGLWWENLGDSGSICMLEMGRRTMVLCDMSNEACYCQLDVWCFVLMSGNNVIFCHFFEEVRSMNAFV